MPEEKRGWYFENAVIARLIAAGWDVSYWKDRNYEVDAVAKGPKGEHWAIEIKTSPTSHRELAGLEKFCTQ
ncbi:MAG: DUF4143 domain-containing protein [Pseudobdellovibrionaceae bacterium]|nr:DUF4143 domain-containing protein [Bdellovibrionales bacterium]USN49045.1 MAG: DUF4143 domain-containing protein [Pseudobdellovibrionaceae bacterium]